MGETRVSAPAVKRIYTGAAKWEIFCSPVGRIDRSCQSPGNDPSWNLSRTSCGYSSHSQSSQTPVASLHGQTASQNGNWLGFDIDSACTHQGCWFWPDFSWIAICLTTSGIASARKCRFEWSRTNIPMNRVCGICRLTCEPSCAGSSWVLFGCTKKQYQDPCHPTLAVFIHPVHTTDTRRFTNTVPGVEHWWQSGVSCAATPGIQAVMTRCLNPVHLN